MLMATYGSTAYFQSNATSGTKIFYYGKIYSRT